MKKQFKYAVLSLVVAILAAGTTYHLYRESSEPPNVEFRKKLGNFKQAAVDEARSNSQSDPTINSTGRTLDRPSPRPTPRELLIKAQLSGLAPDALAAAKSIQSCQWRAGSGQKIREVLIESGVKIPPDRLDSLLAGIDIPERACQELDAGMLAQYEPMLQRALGAGLKGAAAMWWMTPEARSLTATASAANARDLLRRDALECDKRSLIAYQGVSFRFGKDFDPVEVASVQAAAEQLEKQGKLKGSSRLGKLRAIVKPGDVFRASPDQDAVKAKTAEILRACDSA